MADFDVTIIGGGINGTAIARDAAGRGLRVLLVEQNDLASGTSSTSSKLIHGGLRYLEQGAFRMVQEGLAEREKLLRTAPHIIWPARFVLPHHKALRPAWQLRLGLFLYDVLGGSKLLPGTRGIDLSKDVSGKPLQPRYRKAFEYSDCCVDDARLVVLNAVDAAQYGAKILTRTRFEKAERTKTEWSIALSSDSKQTTITSRALINAAGPWMEQVNALMPRDVARSHVKLIKGSHIVVKRLFDHDKCYIFQNADGRIVFAIPYQKNFTLIGTTDYNFTGDPASATIIPEETTYLCKLASDYFTKAISPADVIWSFAGIRALIDNRELKAKNLSRDYLLQLDAANGNAPLLSVYGGKLTAARHVAEKAVGRLAPFFKLTAAWTGEKPLPGGDFPWDGFGALVQRARLLWPYLTETHAQRLVRAYGTRIDAILKDSKRMEDLGMCFGSDLTEAEVRYLRQHEWAQTADDILWRRSKLGLHLSKPGQEKLAQFMQNEKARA